MSDPIRLLAERLLAEGAGDLPARERRLLERVAQRLAASRNLNAEFDGDRTLGQRVADYVAAWGGSWPFIFAFSALMAIWIGLNLIRGPAGFDPYPFILLNLVLSTLAAFQAPIIMMSQNRQAAKDRMQALHDYEVNLKAEIEILGLHEKLDRMRFDELHARLARIEARLGEGTDQPRE